MPLELDVSLTALRNMISTEGQPISRLLLVMDFETWQEGRVTEKNGIKALEAVTRKVYHTLGCHGVSVDRRVILLHLDHSTEAIDACLEKIEGVVLFGKDRAIENMDQAVKHALASQILVGASIVLCFAHDGSTAPTITDRRVETIVTMKWNAIGGKEIVETALQHLSWLDDSNGSGQDLLVSDCPAEHEDQQGQNTGGTRHSSVLLGFNSHELIQTLVDDKVKLEKKLNEAAERIAVAERLAEERITVAERRAVESQQMCEELGKELEAHAERQLLLDFVPLIKTIREYERDNFGNHTRVKALRSHIAEALSQEYSWPIGEGNYNKFRTYVNAAEKAGVVEVFVNQKGGWLRSTGKLEGICEVGPHHHYTIGWPRLMIG